jgi:hypothetical protein
MKIVTQFLILLAVIFITSCSSTEISKSVDDIGCNNPRPEMCTMDYNPVCATKDNGARPTETATYPNACSACSDENVISTIPGECKK